MKTKSKTEFRILKVNKDLRCDRNSQINLYDMRRGVLP